MSISLDKYIITIHVYTEIYTLQTWHSTVSECWKFVEIDGFILVDKNF